MLHKRLRSGKQQTDIQTAALPWRERPGGRFQVLLVTTRDTQQWMLPKGWPMAGRSLADAAAVEAFEEGGVEGRIDPDPIGCFDHIKTHVLLGDRPVRIVVHPLAVTKVRANWPERDQRRRKWFSFRKASKAVSSDMLADLLLDFKRQLSRA